MAVCGYFEEAWRGVVLALSPSGLSPGLFVLGYGVFWLLVAALLVKTREGS